MKTALYLAAIILGGLTALAAFVSPAGAWPLCISALGCLAVANLDRFSELSAGAGGVRLLMRDVQRKVIELNSVAILAAKAALNLIQRSGRLGGAEDAEKDAFLKEATELLKEAGTTNEEMDRILDQNWHRFVRFDYVLAAVGGSQLPDRADLREEWQRVRDFDRPGTPDEVQALLERAAQFHGLRRELCDEYRYYCEHRHHRDPSIWRRRKEAHLGHI